MVRRVRNTLNREAHASAGVLPLHEIAAHTDEAFWVGTADGRHIDYVSTRHEQLWHVPAAALQRDASLRFSVVHDEDRARVERAWAANLLAGSYEAEYRVVQPDGSWRWVRDRAYTIRGHDGTVQQVFGIAQDITKRKEAERALIAHSERLLVQACRDPLTGVLNRRGLERVLSRESERALRGGTHLTAALIDCDDFKAINDRLGQAGGDAVLTEVGQRIASGLRTTDHVARVGGDEFFLLLPETRPAEATQVIERVRRAVVDAPIIVSEHRVTVAVSIGVAEATGAALSPLLAQLAAPLRRSKSSGKNCASGAA